MVSSNSGWFMMARFISIHYIRSDLGKDAVDFTKFDSFTSLPWIMKPIWGWISDSFYPFRYR